MTYPPPIHVVDISPHRLKGNACLTVVVNYLGHIESITVAVAAVMKTEAPVRDERGQTGDLGVLLGDLDGAWASQEVEIEDATEGVVLQVLPRLLGIVDEDVHAVRVEEEDPVRAPVAVLVVDGVVAVQVGIRREAPRVLRPQCAGVVGGL